MAKLFFGVAFTIGLLGKEFYVLEWIYLLSQALVKGDSISKYGPIITNFGVSCGALLMVKLEFVTSNFVPRGCLCICVEENAIITIQWTLGR